MSGIPSFQTAFEQIMTNLRTLVLTELDRLDRNLPKVTCGHDELSWPILDTFGTSGEAAHNIVNKHCTSAPSGTSKKRRLKKIKQASPTPPTTSVPLDDIFEVEKQRLMVSDGSETRITAGQVAHTDENGNKIEFVIEDGKLIKYVNGHKQACGIDSSGVITKLQYKAGNSIDLRDQHGCGTKEFPFWMLAKLKEIADAVGVPNNLPEVAMDPGTRLTDSGVAAAVVGKMSATPSPKLSSSSEQPPPASVMENAHQNLTTGKLLGTAPVGPNTAFCDPVVVASCPESFHDEVLEICKACNLAKAFGQKGDMVDMLSGKDWVGKWEAKVVLASVTQARSMKANHVKIVCIQGGPHCDKEMEAQPKLKKAIKREFGDPSFRVAVEWVEMDDFRERFVKDSTQEFGIFLCHNKSNIHSVLNFKMQLEERLPTARIFCELEKESSDSAFVELQKCSHVILFVTRGVASATHVQSEIRYALRLRKVIVLVLETDIRSGAPDLAWELQAGSADLRQIFETNVAIPWSRDLALQDVSLDNMCSVLCPKHKNIMPQTETALAAMNGEEIVSPLFHNFCCACGLLLSGGSWKVIMWRRFLGVFLSVCSWSWPFMHFIDGHVRDFRHFIWFPIGCMLIALSSRNFDSVTQSGHLQELFRVHICDMHIVRPVRETTRKFTLGACIFFSVCVIWNMTFWIYQAPKVIEKTGWLAAVFIFLMSLGSVVIVFTQMACMLILCHCYYVWCLADAASAFRQLHPQIKDFGIKQSAESGMIVHVSDSDFVRFQRTFMEAWQRTQCLATKFTTTVILLSVFYVFSVASQIGRTAHLMKFGKPRHAVSGFFKGSTFYHIHFLVYDCVLLSVWCYIQAYERTVRMWASKLVFSKPSARVATVTFVKDFEFRFRAGPFSVSSAFQPYVVLIVTVKILFWSVEFYIMDL